ncbi:MAG TPA: hypothetical protein PKO45_07795 [Rubrivivax sp.]|nr:hypothetical protein [Burkholderiales bacterium]HNT39009.1 hypothetical protein [Rubrivivax sp.]
MYEIWLALNILWEIALNAWPWLLALALLATALWALALQRGGARWRTCLGGTIAVGVLAAVATVLVLPAWSQSSLGELAYWVDWATLSGIAAGAAGVAMLLAWPLLVNLRLSRPAPEQRR